MTKREAIQHMKKAFKNLNDEEKANLRYHARVKTPIACQENHLKYTIKYKTGGWPAVLASTRRVKSIKSLMFHPCHEIFNKLDGHYDILYLDALETLDEKTIRELMRKVK